MDTATVTGCIDVREHPGVRRRQAAIYGVFAVASPSSRRATGGGYQLEVRHAPTSRPAPATPFDITVRRPGGFDGPVTVAVTAEYLRMWDENGLVPAPSAETTDGEWVVWELVRDGEPVDAALALEHLPIAEVREAARQEGIGDLADVRLAVLEPSGKISFLRAERD